MTELPNPPVFTGAPMAQITPFTYREGATLMYIVERLKRWSVELGPSVQAILDEALNELTEYVDDAKTFWDTKFNDFLANIISELEALNDQAVANLVNDLNSLLREALDENYLRRGEIFVRVDDHGAKGDGVTDDSAAIASATQFAVDNGASVIIYTRGKTYVQQNVDLVSNMNYHGYGATIKPLTYNAFRARSGNRRGYGASIENTTLSGFTFKGDFTGFDKAAAVTMHHAKNVSFVDIVWDEAILGGHALDLAGCQGISVMRCDFIGFNPPSGRGYAEAIQIDHSYASGVSNMDDPQSYDGLACEDIYVDQCKFLGKRVGGVDYFAPNLIGSHATLKNNHKRIYVSRCVQINGFPSANLNAIVAPVHFQGVEDFYLTDSYFKGSANPTSVVKLLSYSTGIGEGDLTNPSPGPGVSLENRPSRNIYIQRNVFEDYTSPENKGIIVIRGANNGDFRPENIHINGNTFKNNYPTATRGNAGSNPIAMLYCENVGIEGNNVERCRSLAFLNAVNYAKISGNVVNDCEWVCVSIEGTTGEGATSITVSDNHFSHVGSAIYYSKVTKGSVSRNTITHTKDGQSLAGYANGNITIRESVDINALSNEILDAGSDGNFSGAIQYVGNSAGGVATGNVAKGWENVAYAESGSTPTIGTNPVMP